MLTNTKQMIRHYTLQLKCWKVFGPIIIPSGQDIWQALGIENSTVIPETFRIRHQKFISRKVKSDGHKLDFAAIYGKFGEHLQTVAFTELEVRALCTLTLRYDADWYTACWIDGKEIYDARDGNGGAIGMLRHEIVAALTKGKHTVCFRVRSGIQGWNIKMKVVDWKPGLIDALHTERDAQWRKYSVTNIRYEHRPLPDGKCCGIPTENFEQLAANLGVDARWISVVNGVGCPLYQSKYLPVWKGAKPEYEENLKQWVRIIHEQGTSVMTWYPLSLCKSAAEKHPDWRQQYLIPPRPGSTAGLSACCINSPYGEALIVFLIEALQKFNLDGIWFDGSCFTPVWDAVQPISCICSYCRKKFEKETGLSTPTSYDWSLPQFRRWVQWRYDMFSEYWQRLVDTVHASIPEATVVFNHYHRENIGWNGGIPLKPFGRNFISGTEAGGEPLKGVFYTRCMRAYGRQSTEVWTELGTGRKGSSLARNRRVGLRPIMEFVLGCCSAGGNSSFGSDSLSEVLCFPEIAREVKSRAPYINLPSISSVALCISQQTETFVFGRNPSFITGKWTDYYWNSVTGWHHLLASAGLTLDVVFDEHVKKNVLRKYPVLVMPFAIALTEEQVKIILEYVRNGGTLVTGPWFGICDEYGESKKIPLGDRKVFPFGDTLFTWQELEDRTSLKLCGRFSQKQAVKGRPLSYLPDKHLRSFTLESTRSNPILRQTKLGQGTIFQLAVDMGTFFRYSPSKVLVDSVQEFLTKYTRQIIEVVDGDNIILGVFRKGNRNVIVHIQQISSPWDATEFLKTEPQVKWKTILNWNGPKPKTVRCALPELGPELSVKQQAKGQWQVILSPFVWGQVVIFSW